MDPFGPKFFEFVGEWAAAGSPGYRLQTGRETPAADKAEYWEP